MAETDDVQLPDLQVIQRYSLALRGATAPREDVMAALQADLDWLSGGGRRRTSAKAAPAAPVKSAPVKSVAAKVPAKRPATPATRAPAKSAAKKSPARRK